MTTSTCSTEPKAKAKNAKREHPEYCVTLRALPRDDWHNDDDGLRRLRAFLKQAARYWGLQCVRLGPGTATKGGTA